MAGLPGGGRQRGGTTGCGDAMNAADLRSLIREIPDFPQPGIVFKDITPLLLDPAALD